MTELLAGWSACGAGLTGLWVYWRHDQDGVSAGLRRSGGRELWAGRARTGWRWPGRAGVVRGPALAGQVT
jgi:hypothetical protein